VPSARIGLAGVLVRAGEVGARGLASVGARGLASVGARGLAEVGARGELVGRSVLGARSAPGSLTLGSTLSMLTIVIAGASSSRGPESAASSVASSCHSDGSDLGRTAARVPLLVRSRAASISARESFCVACGSPRGSGRVEGISTMPFGQSRARRRCFTAAV
jgi:hypothetical protein